MGVLSARNGAARRTLPPGLAALVVFAATFGLFRDALTIRPVEESLFLIEATASDAVRALTASWGYGQVWWRPFAVASFALERALFGGRLAGFAAVQLAWIALSVWLFFLVARRALGEAPALVAAALFLVLPAHHENVFWLAGRPAVMGFALLCGALALWPEPAAARRRLKTAASLTLAALGMAAHETAFLFPVLLCGLRACAPPRAPVRWLDTPPAWLLTLVLFVLRAAWLGGLGGGERALSERLFALAGALTLYAPSGFERPWLTVLNAGVWLGLAAALALWLRQWSARRLGPAGAGGAAFAALWLTGLIYIFWSGENAPRDAYLFGAAVAAAAGALLHYGWSSLRPVAPARTVVVALGAALLLASLAAQQIAAAAWRQAGEQTLAVGRGFERIARHVAAPQLAVYGLPPRIGPARGVDASLPALARASAHAWTMKNGGPFDGAHFAAFLATPEAKDREDWLWDDKRNELRRLWREPTSPTRFRLAFLRCRGQATLSEFFIAERGVPPRPVEDFRLWRTAGKVRADAPNTLTIESDEARLFAPDNVKPNFEAFQSLKLSVQYDGADPACELALEVSDPLAVAGFERRAIVKPLRRRLTWRLSRYDAPVAAWYAHVAAVEIVAPLPAWAPERRLPFGAETRWRGAGIVFEAPERAGRLRFFAGYAPAGAQKTQEGLVVWRSADQKDFLPEQSRAVRLIAGASARDYTFDLGERAVPIAEAAVLAPEDAAAFAVERIELYRPLVVPDLRAE